MAEPCDAVKRCPRCQEAKPAAEFGRNKSNAGGLSTYCRPCLNAKGRESKVKKAVSLPEIFCRQCGCSFCPTRRTAVFCGPECRAAGQKVQMQTLSRRRYYANWAEHRAKAKAWKKANPDKCHLYRKRGYQKHKAKERAAHDAWVIANRARLNAVMGEYRLRAAAIAEGKAHFAEGEEGGFFLLIRAASGFWRADAPGRRIGATEQIVGRYERVLDRWVVLPPVIATDASRRFLPRLVLSERRMTEKKVRRYKTVARRESAAWESAYEEAA